MFVVCDLRDGDDGNDDDERMEMEMEKQGI